MTVLVTGSSGFVGNYLLAELKDAGYKTAELDESIDITNYANVKELVDYVKPTAVIHLAAISAIPACEKNFELALKVNVLGTENLLSACRELETPPKIIFISSANVYGIVRPEETPLDENSLVKPNNNYAVSKLMAEELVRKYERDTKTDCVIFRSFNHIGPGQLTDFAVPSFASQIINSNNQDTIYVGNLSAERDFTDVRDIVKAYTAAIKAGRGTYNLGSGNVFKIEKILAKLIQISKKELKIEIDPEKYRENDLPILSADVTKVKNDLNWQAEITIDQSLADIYSSLENK